MIKILIMTHKHMAFEMVTDLVGSREGQAAAQRPGPPPGPGHNTKLDKVPALKDLIRLSFGKTHT